MILRKIQVSNFGPFAHSTEIYFEKTITVFTGANDTGKSSALRLLAYMGSGKPIQEDDVNLGRLYSPEGTFAWDEDKDVHCIATYEILANHSPYISRAPRALEAGSEVVVEILLPPRVFQRRVKVIRTSDGKKLPIGGVSLHKLPLTLFLSTMEEVSPVINLSSLLEIDRSLLNLAFGKKPVERLTKLSELNFHGFLQEGEERLNSLIAQILPPSMQMQFQFRKIKDSPMMLALRVKDQLGEFTPFHMRGAGVRKLISMLVYILSAKERHPQESLLLLIDEPENSLHADAQHTLRYFLEVLAESDLFQVIYATHSSSMLNPLSPQSLRLFRRQKQGGLTTSVVYNKPIHDNFKLIREDLGLFPTDSLLYAPVTIIVEGITERQVLPLILLSLEKERVEGFEDVGKLLSLVFFLDGHGSSFELWCRLAKAQGVSPIIVVDADKKREVNQQKVPEKHPDVPIIFVGHREIEDILPPNVYFEALMEEMDNPSLTKEAFEKWLDGIEGPVKNASLTTQVQLWLTDIGVERIYYKDRVMLRAIDKADIKAIAPESFREIVNAIKAGLSQYTSP